MGKLVGQQEPGLMNTLIRNLVKFINIKSNYLDRDKVENLVMNFKNEIESQFGRGRKSNNTDSYI